VEGGRSPLAGFGKCEACRGASYVTPKAKKSEISITSMKFGLGIKVETRGENLPKAISRLERPYWYDLNREIREPREIVSGFAHFAYFAYFAVNQFSKRAIT
jgi:hypothetical protein